MSRQKTQPFARVPARLIKLILLAVLSSHLLNGQSLFGLKATNRSCTDSGHRRIHLAWTAQPGSTSYVVIRTMAPSQNAARLYPTPRTVTYYDDVLPPGSYSYKVQAFLPNTLLTSLESLPVVVDPCPPVLRFQPTHELSCEAAGTARVDLRWEGPNRGVRVSRSVLMEEPRVLTTQATSSYQDHVPNHATYNYVLTWGQVQSDPIEIKVDLECPEPARPIVLSGSQQACRDSAAIVRLTWQGASKVNIHRQDRYRLAEDVPSPYDDEVKGMDVVSYSVTDGPRTSNEIQVSVSCAVTATTTPPPLPEIKLKPVGSALRLGTGENARYQLRLEPVNRVENLEFSRIAGHVELSGDVVHVKTPGAYWLQLAMTGTGYRRTVTSLYFETRNSADKTEVTENAVHDAALVVEQARAQRQMTVPNLAIQVLDYAKGYFNFSFILNGEQPQPLGIDESWTRGQVKAQVETVVKRILKIPENQ